MACRRSGVRAPVAPPPPHSRVGEIFLEPGQSAGSQGGPGLRQASRSLVGRRLELEAIESAIEASLDSLIGISLEGEPGIGKTSLLHAAADMAARHELTPVLVIADEEIRGPLLLAKAVFDNEELRAGRPAPVLTAIERVQAALHGDDQGGGANLPADERLLFVFDQAAIAMRAIARDRPIALLLDDLQWADQDSIRMLRYIVRSNASAPMYLMLTIRPEETAKVTELVTLLADLERLGILRRLRLDRLRQTETAALLKNALGGEPTLATAATIHAQAEGVPFIVLELARTYREAGLLQPIGGTWSLARNAERLVPSAVRTLIGRRAASLPAGTRELLATGAILGRAFRVADLCVLRIRLGETTGCEVEEAFELLRPALAAGLLHEAGDVAHRHVAFSHEQVREYALETLSPAKRQAMHAAIVEMLTDEGEPSPEALPVVVRHALAAGDTELIARFSLKAARAAVDANAPEEALRLVEDALGTVSHPSQRIDLLRIRDDALQALGRPSERLDAIAELVALIEAGGDKKLEQEAQLRRAAALRGDGRHEAAAGVARAIRARALAGGDAAGELAACLELGQDLLRSSLGEGYTPSPRESDLDGAQEAFARAAALATDSGSEAQLASALRELGVITLARIREWFVDRVSAGEHIPYVIRIANGEPIEQIMKELPIADLFVESEAHLTRALELFEKMGDRRGAMSTIVSLAYLNWAPEVHLGTNPAQRFEGIRQLTTAMATLVKGSEREAAETQMLYGVHVFARAKLIPDLAVQRGDDAYQRARALGDRPLEFLAALGTAQAHLDLGAVDEAERWLARAAECAAATPTAHRARQLAVVGALIAGERGDLARMRAGLEDAARMAATQHRPAAQCEALALLALAAAKKGAAIGDEELLAAAVEAAARVRRLAPELTGRPLWSSQADAAEARVELARGNTEAALRLARAALAARRDAMRDDPHLEILMPAARVILDAGDAAEQEAIRGELHLIQAMTAQRIVDEAIRVRWFSGPVGRELAELAGQFQPVTAAPQPAHEESFDERESRLLRLLVQGRSNREIGEELEVDDAAVTGMLSALYARLGTSSRAETTALAFRTM
jgi:DNA-binding CsgD family transcriptional regulator